MSQDDINSQRDIALVNELRCSENALVEFKRGNIDPKVIAKYCSALSNAARIEDKEFAYVLWGVEDATHCVVGTDFDPDGVKGESNTVLQLWLAQRLKPSIAFNFRRIPHPDGMVVLLEIPAASSAPVAFDDIAYVRIGSATPKLTDYPERQQKLITNLRPYVWEKGIAKQFIDSDEVLRLLDYPSYFRLTAQNLPDNKVGILERLSSDQLIQKDVGERWNITNLGAILFANDLLQFDIAISRKAVRFIAYKGKNRATTVTHRQDGQRGYAVGLEGLVKYINDLLPVNEHIGEAFREPQPLFPEIAIRELVANALIHQDMTIQGAGPQIEMFEDRMEITNPGEPLVQTDRMIDLPPRSRNAMLGALMRRMRLCEEQGSGLDKVIASVELYQLPPPKFQSEENSMQVIIYAPRTFAEMTPEERIRACYQHSVLKWLSGERMKNASLCERLAIDKKNAAQASGVLKGALKAGYIKPAEDDNVRSGYLPKWA
jgi:predicted HTH transcriptional regulator